MESWMWKEVLNVEQDGSWVEITCGAFCVGYVYDADADYSHSEHRFYINHEGYIYVHSNGCSCWDKEDAIEEWKDKVVFKTKEELVSFVKHGDYSGYTIPQDIVKKICECLVGVELIQAMKRVENSTIH